MNLELLDTEVADNPEARELVGEATRAFTRITEWNRRFFEIGGQQLFGAAKAMDLTRTISSAAELARHHRTVRTATLELSLLPVSAPANAPSGKTANNEAPGRAAPGAS